MKRFLALGVLMIIAGTAIAQTAEAPILTVEQAQQRAQYAREQMTTAERKVRAAEKKEQAAYKDLEAAQKRMEDAQRAYEETKMRAEQATQTSRSVQVEFDQARAKHQLEYQNLKRAHDAAEAARKAPR